MKQNLQVVKPRARPYRGFWAVYGHGHATVGSTFELAYSRWVEAYLNWALYGQQPLRRG